MTDMQGVGGPRSSAAAAIMDHNPGDLNPAIDLTRRSYEPYRPPLQLDGYQPYARSKTTYNGMNEWMGMQGNVANVPVTMSDGNWRQIRTSSVAAPYRQSTQDDYFQKYKDLMQKRAYRYPNPGKPIKREGNIGGSWRHVKEVLGNKGYRVIYIDGNVRQYDSSKLNEELSGRRLGGGNTPLYSLNRHDMPSHKHNQEYKAERTQYRPWFPPQLLQQKHSLGLPVLYDAKPPTRLTASGYQKPSENHRGFYQRN